jgi:hypothetical protein
MHRLFGIPVTAVVIAALALALPGLAAAQPEDRAPKEFVSGSGKADAGTAQEHLSFTAHTEVGEGCPAKGNVVYKAQTLDGELHLKGRVVTLVLTSQPFDMEDQPGFGFAFFAAEVQSATLDGAPIDAGPFAWFDASDSGQPGGMGDTILLEGFFFSEALCLAPLVGTPITHGNINVQSEALGL